KVQNSRDADGIQLQIHFFVRTHTRTAQLYRCGVFVVKKQVKRQGQNLPDTGGQRSACNTHLRKGAPPENQKRVQYDVADGTRHKYNHRQLHSSDSLEKFFKRQRSHYYDGKGE